MTDLYVAVNGISCAHVRLTVPNAGPWQADVELSDPAALTNPCELRLGALRLTGTAIPEADGTYALQRRARIVGGAGGWSRAVTARGYHNDAGVKARLVVEDVARDIGERLGTFIPARERIGSDYARQAGPASRALVDAIGGASWWVDYDGVTQVGPRQLTTPDAATYVVLSYDPKERAATLTADDPATIAIGAQLSNGLDQPGTVRELELVAGGEDGLRFYVWLGGAPRSGGRLASIVSSLVNTLATQRLWGVYRYRVVDQSLVDDRLDLQSIDPALPDLRSIAPWPGIPGVRAIIAPGGEALVMFAGGDRAQPLVMGYAHYGADGYAPVSLTLGGDAGMAAARLGDSVTVTLPGGATAAGFITGGSSIVKIAPGAI